jgi:hypothetical protein
MQPQHYLRLPGRHASWRSRESAWLGSDHLLLLSDYLFWERYRRYYFRDIQALVLEPTTQYGTLTLALGIPTALSAALVLLTVNGSIHTAFGVLGGIVGLPLLVVLVVHVAKGPTCTVALHTAVQDVIVEAMCRQRAALAAVALLAERIESVQGACDTGSLGAPDSRRGLGRRVFGADKGTMRGPSATGYDAAGLPNGASSGPAVAAGRPMALLLAATQAVQTFTAADALLGISGVRRPMPFFLAVAASIVVASVALTRGPRRARTPALTSIGHALAVGLGCMVVFYATMVQMQMRHPGSVVDMNAALQLDPDRALVAGLLLFSAVGSLLLAAWALAGTLRGRAERKGDARAGGVTV